MLLFFFYCRRRESCDQHQLLGRPQPTSAVLQDGRGVRQVHRVGQKVRLFRRSFMPEVRLVYLDLMPPPLLLPQVVLPRGRRQLRERSHPAQVPLPVPPHPGHVRGQTQPGPAHRGHREAGRQQDGAFKDPSFA